MVLLWMLVLLFAAKNIGSLSSHIYWPSQAALGLVPPAMSALPAMFVSITSDFAEMDFLSTDMPNSLRYLWKKILLLC